MYQYLVQRVYEADPVTVGPFTGWRFTGWHRVTRYDSSTSKIGSRFWLPPGANVDIGNDGSGFEINQMRQSFADPGNPTAEEEANRPATGTVLYGTDLRIGVSGVSRAMRCAVLMEGPEGYGG